jgi:NAD-dependent DNA ligase
VLKGWEVKGNFSKAVTLVVVKEFGKDTEKTKKAREHGIKIITREDFAKML